MICAESLIREAESSKTARQELIEQLGGPLPDTGAPPEQVIDDLVRGSAPGLVASQGGRFFGFVVGGAHPASLAADWLVSAWDQNVGFYVLSPAAAAIASNRRSLDSSLPAKRNS